jgi:FkbM family methyltransferase
MIDPGIDFSQYGQPSFFRQFIPPQITRWVVDVGAHDGIDGSNSRQLILDGWSAVLVEPLPSAFEALKQHCAGFDNAHLLQCACADFEDTGLFFIGKDGPHGQTSSLCNDDIWRQKHSGQEMRVAVRRLTSILEQLGAPATFGLLLVDAEGMDLEVLTGLDFDRYRPAVICTERYHSNHEKERRKHDLLSSRGYRIRGDMGSDTVWVCSHLVGENVWPDGKSLFRGFTIPGELASLPSAGQGVVWLDRFIFNRDTARVSGWGMAPDRGVPPLVLVGLERGGGAVEFAQSARHPRADVRLHFHDDSLFFTGFAVFFECGLPPGPLKLKVLQSDGKNIYENTFEVAENTLA